MLARNMDRLRRRHRGNVVYEEKNAADYKPSLNAVNDKRSLVFKDSTVVVCSQVLIHNVAHSLFREVVENMTGMANRIFVFEDVMQRPTSQYTRLRKKEEYEEEFQKYGFYKKKEYEHPLFNDKIAFFEFSRGSVG